MAAAAIDDRGDHVGRWADLDGLLLRDGNLTGPGFEPGEDVKSVLHDMVHVLVIGAGGLGCELLKDLGALVCVYDFVGEYTTRENEPIVSRLCRRSFVVCLLTAYTRTTRAGREE